MSTVHVFILLVVLCNATAQSGSDASSGTDEDEDFYRTGKYIMNAVEEEVQREKLGSAGSGSSPDEEMDDLNFSGMEPRTQLDENNQHPSPLFEKRRSSSWQNKMDNQQPITSNLHNSFPTITPIQEPEKSANPSLGTSSSDNWRGKTNRKDNYLGNNQKINISLPPEISIAKANSKSNYRRKKSRYGYEKDQKNTKQSSKIEPAHLNKIIDEMKKLKKSKTDEELAKKLRTGAKQVMRSIVKNIVTKTTQTVTPRIGQLIQSSLKMESGGPSKNIIVSFGRRSNGSARNTTKNSPYRTESVVNKTESSSNKPDQTLLKQEASENNKTSMGNVNTKRQAQDMKLKNEIGKKQTVVVKLNQVMQSNTASSQRHHSEKKDLKRRIVAVSFLSKKLKTNKTIPTVARSDPQLTGSQTKQGPSLGNIQKIQIKVEPFNKDKNHKNGVILEDVGDIVHSQQKTSKIAKQEKNELNIHVDGNKAVKQSNTSKRTHKQREIVNQGNTFLKVHRDDKKIKSGKKGDIRNTSHLDGKQSNNVKRRHVHRYGMQNNTIKQGNIGGNMQRFENNGRKRQKVSKKPALANSVDLKVSLQTQDIHKNNRLTRSKINTLVNRRTELITSPTTQRSTIVTSTDDNTYQLQHGPQGAKPSSSNQVNMLQNKVHHLESEVTVLQTAVASLVQRINTVEHSFQKVTNVTQNEVIFGTTPASAVPRTQPSSTQQPPSTFVATNDSPFLGIFNKILPTQQSNPTLQYVGNQFMSRDNKAVPARRQPTNMFVPITKPTSSVQQLQALLTKQQFNYITKTPFSEHFHIKMEPGSAAKDLRHADVGEENEHTRHDIHQVIIPLETLYRMQAQEGLQVPDNNYGESRKADDGVAGSRGNSLFPTIDGLVSSPSEAEFNNNKRKVENPAYQTQQNVVTDIAQHDHDRQPMVRPIVNIIVPNSRAASILEKEMCRIPCKNGGTCNGHNSCKCLYPYSGGHCERLSFYDLLNEKAAKRSESYTNRNRVDLMRHLQNHGLSLKDLIRLGTKFRLNNGQVFSIGTGRSKARLPQRFITNRRKLPVQKKQFIVEI